MDNLIKKLHSILKLIVAFFCLLECLFHTMESLDVIPNLFRNHITCCGIAF